MTILRLLLRALTRLWDVVVDLLPLLRLWDRPLLLLAIICLILLVVWVIPWASRLAKRLSGKL